MNEIEEIQNWFTEQCDGDWEHGWGVRIGTLDNPGWMVQIELKGTTLENASFAAVQRNLPPEAAETETDWLHCMVVDGEFKGFGGPQHLTTILRIFLDWHRKTANQASEATSKPAAGSEAPQG